MRNGINFKKLEEYPITLESFDLNLEQLIDSIYVGPQGDLLQKIDTFNNSYNVNIGVTKHFTLKPGCYDEIKKAYVKYLLRWDMKPRGIPSLFDRVRKYAWRFAQFEREIKKINDMMARLKGTGMVWQDNSEMFISEVAKFKETVTKAIETATDMYPFIEISVKMIPSTTGRVLQHRYGVDREAIPMLPYESLDAIRDYIIVFLVKIKDNNMLIHRLTGDGTIENTECKMETILVASGTYFLGLISRNWNRTERRTDNPHVNTQSFFLDAMYLSNMQFSQHPYIRSSTDKYGWDMQSDEEHHAIPSICLGNMKDEIRATLLNSQIEAHITYLVTWLSNYYIPQTNPLNKISLLRAGNNTSYHSQTRGDPFYPSMGMNWTDCTVSTKIYSSINKYGRGRNGHRYGSQGCLYSTDSDIYAQRKEAHIQTIKLEDMPCTECRFVDECNSATNIELLFQNKVYTPMEEAYIGAFLEYYEHDRIMHDVRVIHYIEELVRYAHIGDPFIFNDRIVDVTVCIRRWFIYNNRPVTLRWDYPSFRRKYSILMNQPFENIKALAKEALNPDSKFVWNADSIEHFNIQDHPVAEASISEEDDLPFNESNDRAATIQDDIDGVEELTMEQRTLRWATQQGGANNL